MAVRSVGWLVGVLAVHAVTQPEFDCTARQLAMDQATAQLGAGRLAPTLFKVHEALRLHECNRSFSPLPFSVQPRPAEDIPTLFVATSGDDTAAGSRQSPLLTLHHAVARSRELGVVPRRIVVLPGRYELSNELTLGPEDSGLRIEGSQEGQVVLSGGRSLELQLEPVPPSTAAALGLPAGCMQAPIPQLTRPARAMYEDRADPREGQRLPWAREPNGLIERDLQPTGYAAAAGSVGPSWPSEDGAVYSVITEPRRNNSVYPVFGRDYDPREVSGWQWKHLGGTASRFGDDSNFFNGSVYRGMRYNTSASVDRGGHVVQGFSGVGNWSASGAAAAIVHVLHPALWGNWQYELQSFHAQNQTLLLGRGGFQEAHGGAIETNPFFVEGVREALDAAGEWWVDPESATLYMLPNSTSPSIRVVLPSLQTLIALRGSSALPVCNVSLSGLTLAFAAESYLDDYVVPSPGDWAVSRTGALLVQNAEDLIVSECDFVRLGGNAIVLNGHAWRSTISDCEFTLIGDSGIASVGALDQNDGVSTEAFPADTLIQRNHFHEIGLTGKQSSALFLATSCRTSFVGNVAYNGPRAGVNINDGFCHGHRLAQNLLFNWVRETQDHGPINTWNRAAYVFRSRGGALTTVPEWTHISNNMIMNGPSGNRDLGNLFPTIDNDDGSAYFSAEDNVLVYGGLKNYLGHDKRWVGNLVLFPDRWSGNPCAQLWGGESHFYVGNRCVLGGEAGELPDPIGLDGTRKGFNCVVDFANSSNRALVGFTANNSYWTQDGRWGFGCGNGTAAAHTFSLEEMQAAGRSIGSRVAKASDTSVATLEAEARRLLMLPP